MVHSTCIRLLKYIYKKVFVFNTQEYFMRSNDIISFLMVDGLRSNAVITFLMENQNTNKSVVMWTPFVIKECIKPLQMFVTRDYRIN